MAACRGLDQNWSSSTRSSELIRPSFFVFVFQVFSFLSFSVEYDACECDNVYIVKLLSSPSSSLRSTYVPCQTSFMYGLSSSSSSSASSSLFSSDKWGVSSVHARNIVFLYVQ